MVSQYKGSIKAYRIADIRHPIFDGTGAMLAGARWNSPGRAVIYASRTYSCALLEKLVHCGAARPPKNQHWIEIQGDNIAIEEVLASELPGWDSADERTSKAYGDEWLKDNRSLILVVPSVVAHKEQNILINPSHPDFDSLQVSPPQPVHWDQRLFVHPEE